MSDTFLLKTEKLSVGYPNTDVLDNVDLSLTEGQTVGLIGLNGAGKTTLIKTILGLRKPKSGSYSVKGSRQSNIAYLPEKFEPPVFLSGYEFIVFSLSLYGLALDRDAIRMAVYNLAFDVKFLDKKVSSYSKGMKQKIGLIATIMTKRPLIILDEPMSGLDPFSRRLVKQLIVDSKKSGTSFLISSHVLSDMEELCDKIAVIDQGHINYFGDVSGFKKQHEDENLERSFMNLILHNRN